MGVIDQMKYAKILYLADVLEDIQNEMNRDYRCHNYAESISDIVKVLRETIAATDAQGEMKCDKIEIKRIDKRLRATMIGIPLNELDYIESLHCHTVEKEILNVIMDNHLIRINKQQENNGDMTFTASLIVGIEKQPYVPKEPMITPFDNILKSMDEKK